MQRDRQCAICDAFRKCEESVACAESFGQCGGDEVLGKTAIVVVGEEALFGTVVGITMNNSKYCPANELHVKMDSGELLTTSNEWKNFTGLVFIGGK